MGLFDSLFGGNQTNEESTNTQQFQPEQSKPEVHVPTKEEIEAQYDYRLLNGTIISCMANLALNYGLALGWNIYEEDKRYTNMYVNLYSPDGSSAITTEIFYSRVLDFPLKPYEDMGIELIAEIQKCILSSLVEAIKLFDDHQFTHDEITKDGKVVSIEDVSIKVTSKENLEWFRGEAKRLQEIADNLEYKDASMDPNKNPIARDLLRNAARSNMYLNVERQGLAVEYIDGKDPIDDRCRIIANDGSEVELPLLGSGFPHIDSEWCYVQDTEEFSAITLDMAYVTLGLFSQLIMNAFEVSDYSSDNYRWSIKSENDLDEFKRASRIWLNSIPEDKMPQLANQQNQQYIQ